MCFLRESVSRNVHLHVVTIHMAVGHLLKDDEAG